MTDQLSMSAPPAPRRRARDFGLEVGTLAVGPNNAITDVPGVRVGHRTVWRGDPGGSDPVIRSGVTAVWPHDGDLFRERVYAGTSVFNGYGEMTSNIVIDEWGLIGSPIVLIDTTHIGLGYDAVVRYMAARDPEIQDVDVVIPVVAETDDGFLNDNRAFGLAREDVWAALDEAGDGPVAEGVVGAATGTQQFDFKGGIGTASRLLPSGHTLGAVVLTNFGEQDRLTIGGLRVDRKSTRLNSSHCLVSRMPSSA